MELSWFLFFLVMFALKSYQNNIFLRFWKWPWYRHINSLITQWHRFRIISCFTPILSRLYTFFLMYNHSPNTVYFLCTRKILRRFYCGIRREGPPLSEPHYVPADMNIQLGRGRQGRVGQSAAWQHGNTRFCLPSTARWLANSHKWPRLTQLTASSGYFTSHDE